MEICHLGFQYFSDSVNHRPLLTKSITINVNGAISDWIRDRLMHHSFYLLAGAVIFSKEDARNGDSKGSVAGHYYSRCSLAT